MWNFDAKKMIDKFEKDFAEFKKEQGQKQKDFDIMLQSLSQKIVENTHAYTELRELVLKSDALKMETRLNAVEMWKAQLQDMFVESSKKTGKQKLTPFARRRMMGLRQ